ncbi:universal stress protein [Moellerella wisconsensis]|uniref:Universal stress protein n=1 Tax=Moellerella wisconsensis ATCC 35017 TaxID=1354267 RepID=A0A0N1KIB8_9GAMM|nr:universal stress protein [Moellerella wisconsensis]KPD03125.1 universal stress protein F [Moellerella wisconsensis ATCC 35017]VFS48763.1 Universal stress protein F [Moellerella wisconsensis]
MYKTILVPIDLLEDDLNPEIIKHVEQLAKLGSPKIHFLSVIPSVELFFGIEVAILPESQKDSAERSKLAFRALEDIIKNVNIPDERIVCNIGIGSAKDEILSYATDINADLIVIGSHHPSTTTYLLGSTASTIVRHANTSVLVIR